MEIAPPQNPEDFFWQQIADNPGEPLPRMLYADWCDENDRPVMSLVQRWLAVTGRRPEPYLDYWRWNSEQRKVRVALAKSHTLPKKLFDQLTVQEWNNRGKVLPHTALFVSWRSAEEALVPAWTEATQDRPFRRAWKPEVETVRGVLAPPPPPRSDSRQTEPSTDPGRATVLISGWLIVFLLTSLFRGCLPNSRDRSEIGPVYDPVVRIVDAGDRKNVGFR